MWPRQMRRLWSFVFLSEVSGDDWQSPNQGGHNKARKATRRYFVANSFAYQCSYVHYQTFAMIKNWRGKSTRIIGHPARVGVLLVGKIFCTGGRGGSREETQWPNWRLGCPGLHQGPRDQQQRIAGFVTVPSTHSRFRNGGLMVLPREDKGTQLLLPLFSS